MLAFFRRLALGLFLIAAASAILLYSDLGSRARKDAPSARATVQAQADGEIGRPAHRPRVALLQHASQMVLDDLRHGMLAGMAERGWQQGRDFDLAYFNAEGDMPVAQTIAQRMASGGYDLLLSISTPSLQAVAAANRAGRTPHLFAGVTLPSAAGVGISATDPMDHPPHLAGYGTLQPVARSFEIARRLNPDLKTVGTIYNAAESNAEAQMMLARDTARRLGITLLETTVENSAGVSEAANALVARGAEAIWICGDTTVLSAVDTVMAAGRKGRVPVFTVIPPNAKKGGLFDVGANYAEVGRLVGQLAGEVLSGTKKPADIAIENVVPETLVFNLRALAGLRPGWSIPPDLLEAATLVIDENGVERHTTPAPSAVPAPPAPAPAPRAAAPLPPKKIAFAYYTPEPSWQDCADGLLDELRLAGYVEGQNLTVLRAHASGESVNIVPMLQNFAHSDVDVIVPFSTPVIQGSLAVVRTKPIVFSYCTDPIAAGIGRSWTDHDPRITGVGTSIPVAAGVDVIRRAFPAVRRVGVLYNAGEANSVSTIRKLRAAATEAGLQLEELTIATPGESVQAVQALVTRRVDLVYIADDNTALQAIDAIVGTLNKARIPLVLADPAYLHVGAVFAVGPGYGPSGRASARKLLRVFAGESPAGIPMEDVSIRQVAFNPKAAAALGLNFDPALIAELTAPPASAPGSAGFQPAPASAATPSAPAVRSAASSPSAAPAAPKRIALILYNETAPADETLQGMKAAWARSPLVAGRDYVLNLRSAQGDIATLGAIYDAALTDRTDIFVPISTPSLQAAIRRVKERPIVFTMVANPIAAGAGRSYTDHLPHVTGISVLAPVDEMLDLLARHYPQIRRIGTLFCPAETNSVDVKDALAAACRARGLTLETVAVNTATELPDAAASLAGRRIDAIVQVSDNLTMAGFTSIAQAARRARKPLFSLNSSTVPLGAPLAMGRDYHAAGEHTVAMIEQVIAGASPADIPILLPPTVKLTVSPAHARAVGMELPAALLAEAKVAE
jgi:ABC-type uncharacterized transport system substrate-binding protein